MEYLEIKNPDGDELIQFHDLLVESFPDPYSREDIDNLRYNLTEGSWENGDEVCRYHLVIAHINQQVVGGTSFYYFRDRNMTLGMGAYLAVKRNFWGSGIGSKLVEIRNEAILKDAGEFKRQPQGLIIQVSDLERMSEEEIKQDPMNPREREKFWRKRGYRKIDFNFIQPYIRSGEPPVEYLSLYMFPYSQDWEKMNIISSLELWNVVNCFIKCTGTIGPAETDPAYLRMKAEMVGHENFQLI